jgi:hypothetical protein
MATPTATAWTKSCPGFPKRSPSATPFQAFSRFFRNTDSESLPFP